MYKEGDISIHGKRLFYSALFSFYLSISLIRFVNPANLFITSILIASGLTSTLLMIRRIDRRDIGVYIYVVLLVLFVLLSALFVNRFERLGHVILFVMSNMGIALLLKHSLVEIWPVRIIFYSLALIFLRFILIGEDPDTVLSVVSHNGISMMILVACVSYYVVISQARVSYLPLMPAVFTLIISIWATGRSGILASSILVIGLLILKFGKYRLLLSLLAIPLGILFFFIDNLIAYSLNIPFLTRAVTKHLVRSEEGEVRMDIWSNYFNNLDISRFFFGANIKTDPWPDGPFLAYNYHNTFINFHAQTGLMAILTFIIFILSSYWFARNNRLLLLLLVVIVARWFTDIGLYFESWDFIPFYFTFVFISIVSVKVYKKLI
jgi:hypothetical protein